MDTEIEEMRNKSGDSILIKACKKCGCVHVQLVGEPYEVKLDLQPFEASILSEALLKAACALVEGIEMRH